MAKYKLKILGVGGYSDKKQGSIIETNTPLHERFKGHFELMPEEPKKRGPKPKSKVEKEEQ